MNEAVITPMTWWTMRMNLRWILRFKWRTKSSSTRVINNPATQGKKSEEETSTCMKDKKKK